MGNHSAPHGHYPHLNDMDYDMAFIEAAHYEREASVQVMSPAQRPLDGTTNVEMYASKDVPVLAYPTLYCMAHGSEHPCKYVHVKQADIGICDLEFASDADKYTEATRVKVTASQSHTGAITRA